MSGQWVEIVRCNKQCRYGNPCLKVYLCSEYASELILAVTRRGDQLLWALPDEIVEHECLEDEYQFDGSESLPSRDDVIQALVEAVFILYREAMEI